MSGRTLDFPKASESFKRLNAQLMSGEAGGDLPFREVKTGLVKQVLPVVAMDLGPVKFTIPGEPMGAPNTLDKNSAGGCSLPMDKSKRRHGSPMKATDGQLLDSYDRTKSVHATAAEFGMCGQSVHERLRRIGVTMSNRPISDYERDQIREFYGVTVIKGDGRLDVFSKKIGRTKQLISRTARSMGLTDPRRSVTPKQAAEMGVSVKEHQREHGHPRGMLGKKHTEATKLAISVAGMGREMKPETVDKILRTRLANHGTLATPRTGCTWKSGWREIGGQRIYARSRWEANYARYLEFLRAAGEIQKWEHEPETFWFDKIKRGTRSYLPDFRVTDKSGVVVYHEVKGWMDDRSKTKIKRMAKYHPTVKLVVIATPWFKANSRKLKSVIRGWEDKDSVMPEIKLGGRGAG